MKFEQKLVAMNDYKNCNKQPGSTKYDVFVSNGINVELSDYNTDLDLGP